MYGIENLKARYKMDGINVELSVDIDIPLKTAGGHRRYDTDT